jgi:hypothetical protein
MNDADRHAYWRKFVEWVQPRSLSDRVHLIQLCVQEIGPAPDDLRPTIEKLLKPLRIRINKATERGAWYARHIGQVLPVEIVEINRRPDQGIPEDVYWCREGGVYNPINYVRKSDATEVES